MIFHISTAERSQKLSSHTNTEILLIISDMLRVNQARGRSYYFLGGVTQ